MDCLCKMVERSGVTDMIRINPDCPKHGERPDAAPPKEVMHVDTDDLARPMSLEEAAQRGKLLAKAMTKPLPNNQMPSITDDGASPPSDAAPVAEDWEPTKSFADIAAKFPSHPWAVADDQYNDYRVVRVAPTVDGTLIIWVVPLYAHPDDAQPLTEMEWKAILDAMLLTEEQCPLVSDAHFAAKEKVRAAISYPTARGLFAHPEDAPGGPWCSENIGDADRSWGPTVWDSRVDTKGYGVTGTSRFYFATLPLAEAVRDVLNRDFLNRLKGDEK